MRLKVRIATGDEAGLKPSLNSFKIGETAFVGYPRLSGRENYFWPAFSSTILLNGMSELRMQPGFAVLRSRQVMKKPDLARDVAKRNGVEKGAAADQMDRVVTRIIRSLRRGQPARLPGLGTLEPGKPWTFRPESHTKSDPGNYPERQTESHED